MKWIRLIFVAYIFLLLGCATTPKRKHYHSKKKMHSVTVTKKVDPELDAIIKSLRSDPWVELNE